MNKDELKTLALKLQFKIDAKVLDQLEREYCDFQNKIKKLKAYPISENVQPMLNPNDNHMKYLREDKVEDFDFTNNVIFENANHQDRMIVVKKVVK